MIHRGPDANGIFDIPELYTSIGHVRLSIIDLEARSNQPFHSVCGRYSICFNGEIYNYIELKELLLPKGYVFTTTSDTEVLLYWLMEHGIAGLEELDGMFAFCLVDRLEKTMLLARDQIGEKPLYYTCNPQSKDTSFAFSSEIKPLLEIKDIDKTLNEEAVADYARFLYTAAPHTMYNGIKELAPGSYLYVNILSPRANQEQYYSLEKKIISSNDISYDEALDIFKTNFINSVNLRLRSDVPLGVYLSGGMDSNAILGAARTLSSDDVQLNTFTMQYGGSKLSALHDESSLAEDAARYHAVPNTLIYFDGSVSFSDSVDRIVQLFSQPFGNGTALVADIIAQNVSKSCKVGLVGDGGDELLGGYPRYKALQLYSKVKKFPNMLTNAAAEMLQWLPEKGQLSTKIRRVKQFSRGLQKPMAECFVDWSTYNTTESLLHAFGMNKGTQFYNRMVNTFEKFQSDPVNAAAIVDLLSFVPYNLMQSADRTSMNHSLELRCPFLSTRLIESIVNIPSKHKLIKGKNKPIMSDSMTKEIPAFINNQPKRPFNPPMKQFLQNNMKEMKSVLLNPASEIAQIASSKYLKQEISYFETELKDNSTLLWGLITFEKWLQQKSYK
ncbi:asparagine synthase (glutamine-hydrolyzing) [Paenibacillus alginolyticus]|uniref:asparagine synthase (glutamine-hydrolyzing) n=2 Tax=Paenibacillus alginolyticus TaxID=59839 RepID=A0ABT4G8Q6_9BACL|nr:asparagine synthase (glutamine-hydrolyzing) [Paenibacillus alginolyticus]